MVLFKLFNALNNFEKEELSANANFVKGWFNIKTTFAKDSSFEGRSANSIYFEGLCNVPSKNKPTTSKQSLFLLNIQELMLKQ